MLEARPVIRPDLAAPSQGKRVLITGGLGFIGSNLARELVDGGRDVVLVDSLIPEYGGNLYNIAGIEDRVRVNISDVRDEHSLALPRAGPGRPLQPRRPDEPPRLDDRPVHRPRDQLPQPALDPRGVPARQPGRAGSSSRARARSTAARSTCRSTRSHPIAPVDVNGINKVAGEWYHLLYGEVYGIRVAVLRLTNTYGPRMRVQRRAADVPRHLAAGSRSTASEILVFGDGAPAARLHLRRRRGRARSCSPRRATRPTGRSTTSAATRSRLACSSSPSSSSSSHGGGSYRLVPFPAERKAIDIGDFYADYAQIRARARLGARGRAARRASRRTLDFYREHGAHYWDGG